MRNFTLCAAYRKHEMIHEKVVAHHRNISQGRGLKKVRQVQYEKAKLALKDRKPAV